MRRTAVVTTAVIAALSLAACGSSTSSSSSNTSSTSASTTAPATLPRRVVVPLHVVQRFFPEVAQQLGAGPDSTARGKPSGTMAVVYGTSGGSRKVTLSVDQYASSADASSAYQEAVMGSKAAPGFKLTTPPKLGQQAFAGTSAVGAEMHFGIGAVDGRLIIAATYAGFPVTAHNSANLIDLARLQAATAKRALGAGAG